MDPLMSSGAVLINDGRACASLLVRNSKLFINPQYWHKVIIHNCEGIQRDVLLKAILDAIHPHDLIPVHFTKEDSNASFIARNCKTAIEKLCQNNLFVANPLNSNLPFKLSIILAYSTTSDLQINVQDNVLEVLNKRYNSSTKTLNLDAFYKDPDLEEFCVLSQPKILYFVLHLSKSLIVHHLKLSSNEISILNPVESLWGVKNLTSLDLRNNAIESLNKLTILSSLSIRELWLDGNPLCDKYDDYTYVQAVKEVCPQIEKLDGIMLRQGGFPAFRRNYLCSPECQEMIDSFMEHYFTIYDNRKERNKLLGIYDQNATFSITSRYLIGQSTSATASLTPYKLVSRNIRTLSDLAKSDENLVIGNEKIIKVITNLPPTEHDPYTFTVDLMQYTDELMSLVVNGVFREPSDNLSAPERILGFTRTFILSANENNEYRIINEQLHISNATTIQQQRAFKVVRVAKENISSPLFTETEKKEMIEAVKTFTTMNTEWSKKCLEECHYNLPKALSLFVDLYKVDNIPEEAFQRIEKLKERRWGLFNKNIAVDLDDVEFKMRLRYCVIKNLNKLGVWAEVYREYIFLREVEKAKCVRSVISKALQGEKLDTFLYEIALSNYETPCSIEAQVILQYLEKESTFVLLNKLKRLPISRALKYIEILLKIHMNSQAMVVTKLYYQILINRNANKEREYFITKCKELEKENNTKFKFNGSDQTDLESQFVK